MTAEELAQREQDAKMRKLENSELMMDPNEHDASEDAKNDTFANQLLTKILNNLQFSITNIHIRYEDDISTNHRFAAGITLSELSAITTDENWNTIHKASIWEWLSINLYKKTDLFFMIVGNFGITFNLLGYKCCFTRQGRISLTI
jgi:vacuolar protein sorting-associated protein 13A/C